MEPSEPGEATSSAGKSKSWLRWLIPRFSLRTLLVATAFCGIVLAFLGVWVERAERQRRVSKEIERLESSTRMDPLPSYLKWLPKSMATFGDGHYVRNVSELGVATGTSVSDGSIETIATLKDLQRLWIGGTKVTDEGIERLREKLPRCNIQTLPPR